MFTTRKLIFAGQVGCKLMSLETTDYVDIRRYYEVQLNKLMPTRAGVAFKATSNSLVLTRLDELLRQPNNKASWTGGNIRIDVSEDGRFTFSKQDKSLTLTTPEARSVVRMLRAIDPLIDREPDDEVEAEYLDSE